MFDACQLPAAVVGRQRVAQRPGNAFLGRKQVVNYLGRRPLARHRMHVGAGPQRLGRGQGIFGGAVELLNQQV
ncbi:hypothetical protein [Hymenobacter sp. BRD67]|uniref:hypothetical protein n=1 Tax=Hymenobacter sp. BRD67 TaxID=2675877 RepID=UPI001566B393|nr:hypothetical protein [Hymenobacter sp. BRD67]QKG51245.1 hypothetical protein GKZ67_10620 [Hymenobacter sp. BRD67]